MNTDQVIIPCLINVEHYYCLTYPPSLWLGSSGLYQASASRPIPLYVLLLDDDSSMQRIEVRFMVIITKRCQREVCVYVHRPRIHRQ